MIDVLAAVTMDDLILVATGIGIFGGGRYAYGKLSRSNGNGKPSRSNGNGFSQRLCDERHKHVDGQIEDVKKTMTSGFSVIYQKLDKIQEHLMK